MTVVKFVGKEHELLVAASTGLPKLIDMRAHKSVTTLMKPSEFDAKTKEVEGVWEGQLKNQHPILDAHVSPTGDRVSTLAWRPAGGVVEDFDAESWSLVSQKPGDGAAADLAFFVSRVSAAGGWLLVDRCMRFPRLITRIFGSTATVLGLAARASSA